jgi:hypothetical protein
MHLPSSKSTERATSQGAHTNPASDSTPTFPPAPLSDYCRTRGPVHAECRPKNNIEVRPHHNTYSTKPYAPGTCVGQLLQAGSWQSANSYRLWMRDTVLTQAQTSRGQREFSFPAVVFDLDGVLAGWAAEEGDVHVGDRQGGLQGLWCILVCRSPGPRDYT